MPGVLKLQVLLVYVLSGLISVKDGASEEVTGEVRSMTSSGEDVQATNYCSMS